MGVLIFLAFLAIFGFIVRGMALKRGRDGNMGFLLGALFGIFAIIGYAIAGDTEERKVERIRRAMN